MPDISFDEPQFVRTLNIFKIFQGRGRQEMERFIPFFRWMDLSFLDYMTIRDLIEYGDYHHDIPLVIILMTMFSALQEGSLCLNLEKEKLLLRFPAELKERAMKIINDFLSSMSENKYERLITRNGDEYMPLILDESRGKMLLYFQKYYFHESRLAKRVEEFLAAEDSFKMPPQEIESILEEIYSDLCVIRIGKGRSPIMRDEKQVKAIQLALGSQFSIITGGPGTGKTSLMVNILRCLVRSGIRSSDIVLGAPTGRAAQRMTEAIQNNIAAIKKPSDEDLGLLDLKGNTLHKILRYMRHKNAFYYRDANPLPASVVVIDEVSMVDVVMLDTFLHALNPGKTKLILLGDKDQLPSVEAGAVFAEMIPDGMRAARFGNRLTVLHKVYRSGIHLLKLAQQANQGALPSFQTVPFKTALSIESDQWAFIDPEGATEWKEHLYQWTKHHYIDPLSDGKKSYKELLMEAEEMSSEQLAASELGHDILHQIFVLVDRARILSIVRNGIYGCNWINTLIAEYLIREFDTSPVARTGSFSGAFTLITRNDYSKGLFNGDVGVTIKDANGICRTFFRRGEEYVSFPANLLQSVELSFAMTVHKSQGSEFDDVLLVLPDDEKHRLLTREIIYTGITRARKRVLVYGSRSAMNTAIQRKIERESGFLW